MRPKRWWSYQANGNVQKLQSGAALCGRLLLTLSINSSCSNFGSFDSFWSKMIFQQETMKGNQIFMKCWNENKWQLLQNKYKWQVSPAQEAKGKNTLWAANNQLWTCGTSLQLASECTVLFCLLMEIKAKMFTPHVRLVEHLWLIPLKTISPMPFALPW